MYYHSDSSSGSSSNSSSVNSINRKNSHPLEINHYNNSRSAEIIREINDCDDDDNDNDLSFENFKYVDGRRFINIEKSCEFFPVDDKVSY